MITFNTKTIIYILLAYLILVILTKKFHRKTFDEMFALPTGVLTSLGNLSPNSYYTVGTLKPGVTTTEAAAQFGGSGCDTSFPSTVYIPYVGTTADDAVCVQTITSIYSDVPQTTTSCTSSNGTNFYRMWTKKSDTIIDTLQSSGGLTITPAKFSGRTCSQQYSILPASSYIGFAPGANSYLGTGAYTATGSPSYCTPINASCNSGDALYEDTNQSCTQPTAGFGFFRYFTKKTTNLEALTLNASKFGGANCTTILSSSAYPVTKYVNVMTGTNGNPMTGPFDKTILSSTGGFVTSYCPAVDARCNISDSLLYTDPGAVASECLTTDLPQGPGSSYYRYFYKKSDNFESSIYTTAAQLYGGKTCTTQIASLPAKKYVGISLLANGTPDSSQKSTYSASSSYCMPVGASCTDPDTGNDITNYTTATTPLLGQCQYTTSGTPICDQNTNKQYQRVTNVSPAGTYISCPVITTTVNGVSDSYIKTLETCPSCQYNTDQSMCSITRNTNPNTEEEIPFIYTGTYKYTLTSPIGSYSNTTCPWNFTSTNNYTALVDCATNTQTN